MDVKLCDRVSKFKMFDSKAGPQAFPKPLKFCLFCCFTEFCLDHFSLTTEGNVLNFFLIF